MLQSIDQLRKLFILGVVIGTLGIALGSLLESYIGTFAAGFVTLGIPISVMVAYMILGQKMDEANRETDAFADSIYYMGFLFTLVALVFSLLSLTSAGGVNTSGLVQKFAVALSTTVFGLFVRTYMSNFRPSAKDELSKLEHEIEKSALSLRDKFMHLSDTMALQTMAFETSLTKANDDLDTASERIKTSAGRMESSSELAAEKLTDAMNDLVFKYSETAEKAIGDVASTSERMTHQVETASDRVSRSVESAADDLEKRTKESLDRMGTSIETSSGKMVKAADLMKERVEKVELPPDIFVQKLGPSVSRLVKILDSATTDINDRLATIIQIQSSVNDLASQLGAASGAFTRLTEKVIQQREAIQKHNSLIEQYYQQIQEDATLTEKNRKEIERNLATSRDAINKIHSELVAAADFMREELSEV